MRSFLDLQGNWIPFASVNQSLEYGCLTPIPSWLNTVDDGQSPAVDWAQPSDTNGAHLSLATATALDSKAGIEYAYQIQLSGLVALRWTIEGFYQNSTNNHQILIDLSDSSNNSGCSLFQNPNDSFPTLRTYNFGTNNDYTVRQDLIKTSEGSKGRKKLSIIMLQRNKEILVTRGDQIIFYKDVGWGSGDIRPKFRIINKVGGTPRTAYLRRVSLDIWND